MKMVVLISQKGATCRPKNTVAWDDTQPCRSKQHCPGSYFLQIKASRSSLNICTGFSVNGFLCKKNFSEVDFSSMVIAKPGATNNTYGSLVTGANVMKVPGLNTLGVSLSRIDYAPGGINPPHTHPRATEMIFVLEGELDVGFITTANVLISKHIIKGEVFAFPKGLVHFQKNNGKVPAAVISAFNSQLPGTQSIATTLFAATPTVSDDVLAKAFQIGTKQVEKMKTRLAPKK